MSLYDENEIADSNKLESLEVDSISSPTKFLTKSELSLLKDWATTDVYKLICKVLKFEEVRLAMKTIKQPLIDSKTGAEISAEAVIYLAKGQYIATELLKGLPATAARQLEVMEKQTDSKETNQ